METKKQKQSGFTKAKGTQGSQVEKRLFTLQEAGHYLGRSAYSVRGLIQKQELPVVRPSDKDGAKMWLDRVDLDAWITKNKEFE